MTLARLHSEPDLRSSVNHLFEEVSYDYNPQILTHENAVRAVSAPVFDPSGEVVMSLVLFGLPFPTTPDSLAELQADLVRAAARVSASLAEP
jgi:DNA-binding IclR family transcriptional regulator